MALATPTISVTDGGKAAVNLSNNATAYVTPGNTLTVALQSSTNVLSWTPVITSDYPPLNQYVVPAITGNGPFSFSIPLPNTPCKLTVSSEVNDGNNISVATNFLFNFPRTQSPVHVARAVITSNQATLSSVSTTQDGLTLAQGDVVLLVGQSTASQNGLYFCGLPGGGNTALTRTADWATGQTFLAPQVIEVSEGTAWNNSTWKVTSTGAFTVDTTNVTLFPRVQRGSGTLSGGTLTVSTLWVLSSAQTVVVANDTTATAAAMNCNSITAGSGNGSCVFKGTTTDTFTFAVINW